MSTNDDYRRKLDRYQELVTKKSRIEGMIKINSSDPKATELLRKDFRSTVDEIEKIYQDNIEFFNQKDSQDGADKS